MDNFFKKALKTVGIAGAVVAAVEGGDMLKKNIDLSNQQEKELKSIDSLHHEEFVQWAEKIEAAKTLKELPSMYWKAKPDFELNGGSMGHKEDMFDLNGILVSVRANKNYQEERKISFVMQSYLQKFKDLFNLELLNANSYEDMVKLNRAVSELAFEPATFIRMGADMGKMSRSTQNLLEDQGRIVDGVYYNSDYYYTIEPIEKELENAMGAAWGQSKQGVRFYDDSPGFFLEPKEKELVKDYLR